MEKAGMNDGKLIRANAEAAVRAFLKAVILKAKGIRVPRSAGTAEILMVAAESENLVKEMAAEWIMRARARNDLFGMALEHEVALAVELCAYSRALMEARDVF